MFPRIREIIDPFGRRLRLSVEPHAVGALIAFERLDEADSPRVLLDGYGAELVCGYVMAARLALPHPLPDEAIDGHFAAQLRLVHEPKVTIEIGQRGVGRSLEIPATLWDKLYAELCLVIAHAREMGRRQTERVH